MSFNIDKIIKECPSAVRKWILFTSSFRDIFEIEEGYLGTNNSINIHINFPDEYGHDEVSRPLRDLYDFFDSVGIKISVYFDADDDWCYEILALNSELIIRERWYSYREDVERVAIPKAFEIYEKQLKGV